MNAGRQLPEVTLKRIYHRCAQAEDTPCLLSFVLNVNRPMFYRSPYSFRFLMLDGSLSLWPELTNVHTEGKTVKIYWYAESKVFRIKKS